MNRKKKAAVSSRRDRLVRVSAEDIFNKPLTEEQKATLERIAAQQQAEDPEWIVPLRDARPKVAVSVRLEPRVIEWLKRDGKGHVSRINDILVQAMLSERR